MKKKTHNFKPGDLVKVIEGDEYECVVGEIHMIMSIDGTPSVGTVRCVYDKVQKKYLPTSYTHYYHKANQFVKFNKIEKKEFSI